MDTMVLVWFILVPAILGLAAFLLARRESRAFDRRHDGRTGKVVREIESKSP